MNTREIIIKHEYKYTKPMLVISTIIVIIISLSLSYQHRLIGPGYKLHIDKFIILFITLEFLVFLTIKIPEFRVPSNGKVKIKVDSDESGVTLKCNFSTLELERGEIFRIQLINSRVIIMNSRNQKLEFLTTKSYSQVRTEILQVLQKDNNIRLVKDSAFFAKRSYLLRNLIETPN